MLEKSSIWFTVTIITLLTTSQTIVTAKTSQEISQVAQEATVQINNNLDSEKAPGGSGVIIAKQGDTYTVLSANHVVCKPLPGRASVECQSDVKFTIRTHTGQEYTPIRIEHIQKSHSDPDLAFVTFKSPQNYQIASIGNSNQVSIGSGIYVAGFPAYGDKILSKRLYTFKRGDISSIDQNPDKGYALGYSADTRVGMSGGAVLDESGRVVGIHGRAVEDTIKQRNFESKAIPINTFKELCAKNSSCPQIKEDNTSQKNSSEPKIAPSINNPQSARDFYKKGLIQHARNNYQEAIANYTQALQNNPDPDIALSAYLNRGFAYSNLGQWQQAIADYNQVIKIEPNHTQAYAERGDVRSELGDVQGALEDYNKAIALNPYSAFAYNNRAFILNRQDNFFGAAVDLHQASQILLESGQMIDYQTVTNNLKKIERNDRNLSTIRSWGLTLAYCSPQTTSLLIDTKKYCTEPTQELKAGTYQYIRSQDRLEPITSNNSNNTVALITTPQFTFTGLKEYGDCLEDIIRLHQNPDELRQKGRIGNCLPEIFQTYINKGITQSQGLELIEAANTYATTQLLRKYYPFPGHRRRIKELFGFTYDVDQSTSPEPKNSGF